MVSRDKVQNRDTYLLCVKIRHVPDATSFDRENVYTREKNTVMRLSRDNRRSGESWYHTPPPWILRAGIHHMKSCHIPGFFPAWIPGPVLFLVRAVPSAAPGHF